MDFTLVKGDPSRLEEYCQVFYDSKLYDAYFADSDRLPTVLTDAMNKGELYVAMSSKNEPVGVMHMTRDGLAGLPYLSLLGVKKRYRGMGIGTALVKIFIGVMEAGEAPNMFIMTSKFNVRAKKLYQSLGFEPQCLLHDVMRRGVSEWLFMRPNRRCPAH
ncbi:GNAT family N-acetyltransferase [Flavonifractor sp. HCP28S3_F3]|uniref:GNAT family N-acetyltransferase n=1 Tax=Flavonifractor sp. HCP28S3_F3 TaxID=3438939 RepID=UPI003F8B59F7